MDTDSSFIGLKCKPNNKRDTFLTLFSLGGGGCDFASCVYKCQTADFKYTDSLGEKLQAESLFK